MIEKPITVVWWNVPEVRHFMADVIYAESNRYAADMPFFVPLQAKARSFHLLPAPCAYDMPHTPI